jgi:tRNA(Arg) A34 adenosine deaminase TadA
MAETPKPYVLNPKAPIARNWEKPLYIVATVPALNLAEEIKERHRIYALLLFALMRRFFNGNKNGLRGEYPWREKQKDDEGRYIGGDYLGHNIGAVAVDGTGEVIDFDFNHNQIFGSSAEHAEARLIRRIFSLTQLYDGWATRGPDDTPRTKGYSTVLGNVTVYTSLESCAQCSGVMALGQVGQVVYLQRDPGTYHIGKYHVESNVARDRRWRSGGDQGERAAPGSRLRD